MQLTLREIQQALKPLGARDTAADERAKFNLSRNAVATGYAIDSRTLNPGDLFFAIRGPHFDGHDFVRAAREKGSCGAVVAVEWAAQQGRTSEAPAAASERNWIVVPDPAMALQTLAAQVRRWWGGRVVGVTGSAGKTTVKEICATLVGTRQRVYKSEGNLNNLFGVPLTLLRLDPGARVAVLELAMSAREEIRRLAQISAPNVGVVTNVNPVHLQFFSSVDEIAGAKRELVEELDAQAVAVLNADDARVIRFRSHTRARVRTYGVSPEAEVRVENINLTNLDGSRFDLQLHTGERLPCRLPLLGRHNVWNAAAAVAAALEMDVSAQDIAAGLEQVRPAEMRGEILKFEEGVTVVNDTYNSNPRALEEMVSTIISVQGFRRKIVAAGEMLELGDPSQSLHEESGEKMARSGIDVLVATQGHAEAMARGARRAGMKSEHVFFCRHSAEAGEKLCQLLRPGDLVLLKGSRGVRMEVALEALRQKFSQEGP